MIGLAAKQVRIAHFFLPGLPGQRHYQRRFMLGEALQGVLHVVQIVKLKKPVGVDLQFTRSLRAAQQQGAEQGEALALQFQGLSGLVLVLGYPRPPGLAHQAERFQLPQRVARFRLPCRP